MDADAFFGKEEASMQLAREKARALALRWVSALPFMPSNYSLDEGKVLNKEEGWFFAVNHRIPSSRVCLRVLTVSVSDEGVVTLKNDRRKRTKEILSTAHGFVREERLFTALEIRNWHTPRLFRRIKKSGNLQDMRGIDAFVHVFGKGIQKFKIPIQIKSSIVGMEGGLRKRPDSAGKVAFIIVKANVSDEKLRQQVYARVGHVRKRIMAGKLDLQAYFDNLFNTKRAAE